MNSEKLTPKERMFVAHYLETEDPVIAYKRAGYSCKGKEENVKARASNLLKKREIIDALDYKLQIAQHEADLLGDENEVCARKARVIKGLEDIAFDENITPNRGRLKALELLGKYCGLFSDKSDSGKEDHSFTFNILPPKEESGNGISMGTKSAPVPSIKFGSVS